jgi:catechol 2,3-dioxygenase-like lactoylglutathione lyase family enzyme
LRHRTRLSGRPRLPGVYRLPDHRVLFCAGRVTAMRYLVDDVPTAVDFYTEALGFSQQERFGDAFALLRRDDLELWLSGPQSSARRRLPDGSEPSPGGWNRLVLIERELAPRVERLRDPAYASVLAKCADLAGHRLCSTILRVTRSSCSRRVVSSRTPVRPIAPRPWRRRRCSVVGPLPGNHLRRLVDLDQRQLPSGDREQDGLG